MFALRQASRQTLLVSRAYSTATAAPTTLDQTLRAALKASMKARDSFQTGVIKSVLADLQTASHTASPPSPVKTLAKSISSRLDAAETFLSSTPPRADLAEQYQKEAAILKTFVEEKETMASDALDALVKTVLGELGLEKGVDGKSVGQVIKQVVEKAAGKAGGKEVSEAVRRVAATLTKA